MGRKVNINGDGVATFDCPGCGHLHAISVRPLGSRPVWGYNDDADRPTFTPSVLYQSHLWTPPVTPANLLEWRRKPWEQVKVPHVCHSFVIDGMIQYLSDCTHNLAGQTVELPDMESSC